MWLAIIHQPTIIPFVESPTVEHSYDVVINCRITQKATNLVSSWLFVDCNVLHHKSLTLDTYRCRNKRTSSMWLATVYRPTIIPYVQSTVVIKSYLLYFGGVKSLQGKKDSIDVIGRNTSSYDYSSRVICCIIYYQSYAAYFRDAISLQRTEDVKHAVNHSFCVGDLRRTWHVRWNTSPPYKI